MDFLEIANEVLVLLTGILGLVGTCIGTYFAIKNWFSTLKEKTNKERWAILMEMADAAMTEAEASLASGEEKKQLVMDSINAAATAAGINMQEFTEQLSSYIDQTIAFVNKMKDKTK